MKNINKKIMMIILLVMIDIIKPINVKADLYDYEYAITKTNQYILNSQYDSKDKYLIINNMPYEYEETLKVNPRFIYGGMINKKEYEISVRENKSYLSPGVEYWTQTGNEENNNEYYIDTTIREKEKSKTSGVRVTEYIKDSTLIRGEGTYPNPYTFSEDKYKNK